MQETKLGIALAKLKKEGSESIAKLSSDLIAQWKSLVTSSATAADDKPSADHKRKREDEETDGKDVKRRANESEGVVKLNASGGVVKSEVKAEDKTPVKNEAAKTPVKAEPAKIEPVKTEVVKSEPVMSDTKSENGSAIKFEVLTTSDPARIAAIKKFVDALKKSQGKCCQRSFACINV